MSYSRGGMPHTSGLVLEHFVGFDFQIAQGGSRLDVLGTGLQLMTHFGRRCPADLEFPRQLRRWFCLQHPLHEQHRFFWREVSPFKHCAAVHIENALALLAAIDGQIASLRLPKPARLLHIGSAVGTFHPVGMKIAFDPIEAHPSIH
jgi:hypothetical protein